MLPLRMCGTRHPITPGLPIRGRMEEKALIRGEHMVGQWQPNTKVDTRLYLYVALSVALTYALSFPFEAPDLPEFNYVWLEHIRSSGPLNAFSVPFSNYTPPYLYLLTAVSTIGATPLATVKIISIASCALVAISVRTLLVAIKCDKAVEAGLMTLLLPTLLINGPLLGQCDGLWVAFCILAVAESARGRLAMMALWAGVGFAFKAQAVFIAPFCAAVLWRHRIWWPALIPPAVYLVLLLPAAAAGWPLSNLLSIYAGQYDYLDWLSTAPNLWAALAAYDQTPPQLFFVAAYVLSTVATIFYVRRPETCLVAAALLSAIYVPWLMPKMHERYFLLADVLALCLASTNRRSWPIMVAVQLGSLLSLSAYILNTAALNVVGSLFMSAALLLLLRQQQPQGDRGRLVSSNTEPTERRPPTLKSYSVRDTGQSSLPPAGGNPTR